ncbi:SCO6880 family protein [Frankia sp. AgPm24]|uniref:SCO6880 family protein n=1 Tax=Frankia sp. AgPm24 TaxID=631128 RepID=UPI0035ADB350
METYHGWKRDRAGSWALGLSLPRALLVVAAVVMTAYTFAYGGFVALPVVLPVAGLMLVAAWLRVQGLAVGEWVLRMVRFRRAKVRRETWYAGAAWQPAADPRDPAGLPRGDLPGVLAPLRFLTEEYGAGSPVAVVHHPYEQTYTVVLHIQFPGLALADAAAAARRVGAWGGLLAGWCEDGKPVSRVGLYQRYLPEDGAELVQWTAAHTTADAPDLATHTAAALLGGQQVWQSRHEAYLTISLSQQRARASIKAAGGGDTGAAAVLIREVGAAGDRMRSAGIEVRRWLGVRDLAEVIRTAFDPHAAGPRAAHRAAADAEPGWAGAPAGVDPELAGPAAAEAKLGSYHHDGGYSVTYQVYEWPRSPVAAGGLVPVLRSTATARRAIAMLYEPLPPSQAERAVMGDITRSSFSVSMRQRTGGVVRTSERQALADAQRQESENALGHGLVKFAGYLTVTVTDPERLEEACAELEADAAGQGCRLVLRRLWMAQDAAFATTLPLGLGLPGTGLLG